MTDDLILEPLDKYNNLLKKLHHENSEKYFDDLVKKSGINVLENKTTVKKYQSELREILDYRARLGDLESMYLDKNIKRIYINV